MPEKLDSIYRSWNPFIVVGHCADIHKNDFKENAQEFFVLFFSLVVVEPTRLRSLIKYRV